MCVCVCVCVCLCVCVCVCDLCRNMRSYQVSSRNFCCCFFFPCCHLDSRDTVSGSRAAARNLEEAKVPRNSLMKMVKSNTLQSLGGASCSRHLQRLEDLVERCWKLEEPERTGCLARVVRSNVFGLFCGAP